MKIKIIPIHENKESFDADYALLKKKMPNSKNLSITLPSKSNDGFLLYDLLDVCTIASIS